MKVRIELDLEVAERLDELIGSFCDDDIVEIWERERLYRKAKSEKYNEALDILYSNLGAVLKYKNELMEGK